MATAMSSAHFMLGTSQRRHTDNQNNIKKKEMKIKVAAIDRHKGPLKV